MDICIKSERFKLPLQITCKHFANKNNLSVRGRVKLKKKVDKDLINQKGFIQLRLYSLKKINYNLLVHKKKQLIFLNLTDFCY